METQFLKEVIGKSIIILGSGGHASVLLDMLMPYRDFILGIITKDVDNLSPIFNKYKVYDDDKYLFSFEPSKVVIVNGLGSLPNNNRRHEIHAELKKLGYVFLTVVAPSAVISRFAVLGEGVQVMPGAIINANVEVGDGTIINTAATVDHDCKIGRHNHIAPGVTISGKVETGDYVHVGTGASVIQSITLGDNVIVGAGSTVTKSLPGKARHYVARPYVI